MEQGRWPVPNDAIGAFWRVVKSQSIDVTRAQMAEAGIGAEMFRLNAKVWGDRAMKAMRRGLEEVAARLAQEAWRSAELAVALERGDGCRWCGLPTEEDRLWCSEECARATEGG